MPWWRSSFRARSDCAHLPMTSRTCSPTERWFVTVTPSILIEVTRRMSGICGGWPSVWLRLQLADLTLLSLRLLFCAHWSTWSSSAYLELALIAGITIWVSSAYVNIKFPALTVVRSVSRQTYRPTINRQTNILARWLQYFAPLPWANYQTVGRR